MHRSRNTEAERRHILATTEIAMIVRLGYGGDPTLAGFLLRAVKLYPCSFATIDRGRSRGQLREHVGPNNSMCRFCLYHLRIINCRPTRVGVFSFSFFGLLQYVRDTACHYAQLVFLQWCVHAFFHQDRRSTLQILHVSGFRGLCQTEFQSSGVEGPRCGRAVFFLAGVESKMRVSFGSSAAGVTRQSPLRRDNAAMQHVSRSA